jgi:hypothetical protein
MSKKIPVLLIIFLLTACGRKLANTQEPEPLASPTSQTTTGACSAPSSWMIQFHRTGGFGGFDESLTLNNDGNLTVQSKRPSADAQKQISADQVRAITDSLVQACPFEAGSSEGNCADCFLYTLDIQMDGHTYTVKASDVTLTDQLRPLIDELSPLLQSAQ